jgi:hypothetical protein
MFSSYAAQKHYVRGHAPIHYFTTILSMSKGNPSLYVKHIEHNTFIPASAKLLLFHMHSTMRLLKRVFTKRPSYPAHITCDLSGTPFAEYRHPDSFDLIHDNAVYTFKHSDMHNIIQSALTHSYEFVTEPLPIRNPYTGVPFNPCQLWLIWLRMKQPPTLFTYFLKCKDTLEFSLKYEALLRSYIIDAYIRDLSEYDKNRILQDIMFSMVLNGDYEPNMDRLKKREHKLIKAYVTSNYTLNPSERESSAMFMMIELFKLRNGK